MSQTRPRLILFTRFPVPGKVKTRLIPALGPEGAAALHRRLVLRTLRTAKAACQAHGVDLEIRFAGDDSGAMEHWLGFQWRFRAQCAGDLGQRMAGAFADSFAEGSPATVIIGSDCPNLTAQGLAEAFSALRAQPAVLGPATDGGYYLIGLTRPMPELFQGIAWGTDVVLEQSLNRFSQQGIAPVLLKPLGDVDRPEDVIAWQQRAGAGEARLDRISVILPALKEAAHLATTLEHVRLGMPAEVIVVDGGSTDGTPEIARQAGASVVISPPGRARQMNAGAAEATGEVFLFLHADTHLPSGWTDTIRHTLAPKDIAAGAFAFRIREEFSGRRLVEWGTNLRSRRLQCPYGDQGLFLRRSVFEELGGFADLPLMEDYEFNIRLRHRGRVVTAEAPISTSGRRWIRLGALRTTVTNALIVAGYHAGIQHGVLARLRHERCRS